MLKGGSGGRGGLIMLTLGLITLITGLLTTTDAIVLLCGRGVGVGVKGGRGGGATWGGRVSRH